MQDSILGEAEAQVLAEEIFNIIGKEAVSTYFVGGGMPNEKYLVSRSGRTAGMLANGGWGAIRKINLNFTNFVMTYGVDLKAFPGLRLLEKGGKVTPRQRRFFWAQYYNTKGQGQTNEMWLHMALFKRTFKARYIIRKALENSASKITDILRKKFGESIEITMNGIIRDSNNANNN